MKILICGASGLVGTHLVESLENDDIHLTLIGRDLKKLEKFQSNHTTVMTWSDLTEAIIQNHDVIVNLAGENTGEKKWSAIQKEKIIHSRVQTTQTIAQLCAKLGKSSPLIIQASAIGIYGTDFFDLAQDRAAHESDVAVDKNKSFLSEVAVAWEDAIKPAILAQAPVVILRFGVILDKNQGALAKMLPSFRFGAGAILGTGQQPFAWVSIDDAIKAIRFFINHPTLTGPFNIVSDEVVSQKYFAKTLANNLHLPCVLTLPAFIIQCIFGEMGKSLLLEGCNVSNHKIKKAGFEFDYPNLDEALKHILKKR
jgi:uncharacterized protein (TIGR01777 family)